MKDLTKILKEGETYWSNVIGDVVFKGIKRDTDYPIMFYCERNETQESTTKFGEYFVNTGICTIFPSREVQNLDGYQPAIPDMALVECWDEHDTHARVLLFYDAKNKRSFSYDGKRNGYEYDNYHQVPDTEWAIEKRKTLEQ